MESTENKNYTGSGQGNLNTVLGAIGTAGFLGLFNGTGIGIGGNREPPVSQRELDAHAKSERELTEKDAIIGQLKAEKYADAAVLTAERRIADKIEKIETTMNAGFRQQGEYNVANTAAVTSIAQQTNQLMRMTGLIISGPVMAQSEAAATAFKVAATPAAANANASGNGQ